LLATKWSNGQVITMRPQVNLLAHWLGRFWIWILGWTIQAEPFPGDKFVLIGAPHTSNMDFFYMIATSWVLRIKLYFIGKHTLFRPPFGWILKALGGIPVDRRASHGVVDQVAEQIKAADEFILVITPAGTRKFTDHWKSGFYWIAFRAQVPIVCGALDYRQKKANLGLSFEPSGDVGADMDRIRAFFQGVRGRFPHEQTRMKLREELAESN
jgi:1-acyl-sn-glycerol-3-phosphate acyltransferase